MPELSTLPGMEDIVKEEDSELSQEEFDNCKVFLVDAEKRSLSVDEGKDSELDIAVDRMLARWMNSTDKVYSGEDLDTLKILCKNAYFKRLETEDSRSFWTALKENIL